MRPERNHIRKTEADRQANMFTILILAFVVFAMGTYFIFNTSYSRGPNMEYSEPLWQVAGAIGGLVCVAVLYWQRRKLELTKEIKWFLVVMCIVLLLLPLIPGLGVERNGAKRWIRLGIMIQPSEIVKLLLIITLAAILEPFKEARHKKEQMTAKNGITALATIGAVCTVLVGVQDDLGTAIVVGVIGLVLCIVASVDTRHILISSGLAFLMITVALLMEPYRLVRMYVWLDPLKHLKDEGMQTAETLMGIGHAGWLGVGLGEGRIKWNIPAANTDFAFATIVEELGLIGAMLFAILVFALAWNCVLGAAKYAKSRYAMLIGTGVGLWLMIQTGFNMMVVLNFFPPTGFPLPFASSGGTAIAMNVIAIGVAMIVVAGTEPEKAKTVGSTKNKRKCTMERHE